MDNFDLKKYLVENKLTKNSKILKEIIDWDRASEFYETGNYVVIKNSYGNVEFGLEELSDGDEALFINEINIKPEFQNQGYGTKILKDAIAYAKKEQIPIALRASVGGHYDTKSQMNQEQLIDFYKKFGFELRPDLSNFGSDNVFMVKHP
jgi:GNAT superfamily N-acetyltransferase